MDIMGPHVPNYSLIQSYKLIFESSEFSLKSNCVNNCELK